VPVLLLSIAGAAVAGYVGVVLTQNIYIPIGAVFGVMILMILAMLYVQNVCVGRIVSSLTE
jgi:hypothetical protein